MWEATTLNSKCECEFCATGQATTHNDASHDQSLHTTFKLSNPSGVEIVIEGGTTKCARVLSDFLQNSSLFPMPGRSILELGAGTCLVGLVCSHMGANVVLTDQEPVLPVLQQSVEDNTGFESKQGQVSIQSLYWGVEVIPEVIQATEFDYIIGSDLIFANENIPLLLETFNRLCRERSQIIFAHIDRFSWEASFFSGMLDNGFIIEELLVDVDVKLFRFTRPDDATSGE